MLNSIFLLRSLLKAFARNNFPILVQQMLMLSQTFLLIGPTSLLQAIKMLSVALYKHKHSSVLWVSQVCLIFLSHSYFMFIRYSSTQSLQAGTPLSMLHCQHCHQSLTVCTNGHLLQAQMQCIAKGKI